MLTFSTGRIVTGIIVGIIMGVLHGIFITYYSLSKSNVIGNEREDLEKEPKNLVFHVKDDL